LKLRDIGSFFGLRFHILMLAGLFLAMPARGAIGIDATVSADQNTAKNTVSTPAFSTASGNELLLAFISSDGPSSGTNTTVSSVAGAGLTWVLVKRTNTQLGTAEIWRTFATTALTNVSVTATLSQSFTSSLTVMSFTGVNTTGTNGSGAIGVTGTGNANPGWPTASLVTTKNNSLVIGVGYDWDNAIAHTAGANQTIVHQYFAPVGDTHWVQMQNAATPLSGTSVTINDTAPTGDRYNLSIVEVLPVAGGGGTTFSISGTVTGGGGATVALTKSGTPIATVTADTNGAYTFSGVANGTYVVTPTESGFTISPASQSAPVSGANVTVPNFTATAQTYSISGTISPAASGSGATVALSGTATAPATADTNGNYTFTGLANGSYAVTPTKSGFTFAPATQNVTVSGANPPAVNFTAAAFQANFTVDGSQIFQTMNGTGVNINVNSWNGGQLQPALDALSNTNGTTVWRVIRDPMDWVSSESRIPLLHSLDPTTLQQVYEAPKMQDIWNTLGYLNQKGIAGNQIKLNFMGWTPTWLGGSGAYGISSYITSGKESEFATMVASLVYYGRKVKNLNFTLLSPLNESDWNCLEGPCVGASQYATVLHDLVTELNYMGLSDVRIVGPDTASSPSAYTSAMMADSVIAGQVDHLSFHQYNGSASLGSSYPPRNYWLTEAGAICTPCDTGGTPSQGEWAFASQTSDYLLGDLANGFASVLVYDGYDSFYYHHNSFATTGLLAYNQTTGVYTPRTRFYTNAQINAFISPGAVRIAENDSISALGKVVAYYNSTTGKITIIGHNTGSSSIAINGQLLNLPAISSLAIYQTNSSVNLQRGTDVPVTGGTFTVTIPADTFFSMTGGGGPTFSISGTAGVGGATVTLSGAASAAMTADTSGNYTFSGLANGSSYTVTPTKSGYAFSPTSLLVPISGANATANFTATPVPTYSISGTISPAASGSGATITLSGAASTATSADNSGNYSFTGLANGSYTVTPTKAGFNFNPTNQTVTLNGANNSTVNFTAQAVSSTGVIAIDANTSKDQSPASTTVSTPSFSTVSGNELLLAFVGADYQPSQSTANVSVTGLSGGGLTWMPARKTNTQDGTAEVWRAFAPSALSNITVTATLSQSVQSAITVMSFSGIDTSGTNGSGAIGATGSTNASSGAPTATLVTTRNNSWVLGVGNDYDNAIARTLGSGQSLVHQDLAPINDTYWVQRQNSPTPLSGTNVTINDTAPTSDRYNLSIVEVLPSLNQTATPDLTITKNHSGNFVQSQTGANYTLTAMNSGGAATSGTVTVTDTLPASLTPTAISGTNWNCTLATLTCTRSDTLAAAASYPAITLTVNVASNAPASVTNTATVSGGGESNTTNDTANDVTTINASSSPPDMTISKSHSGNFSQGQTGATYSITVTNSGGSATSGTVTMTDALPASLTPTAISGTGWTCTLATLTCTRSDALAAAASYPAITLTVNVAGNAPASITNTATVSGGGETNTSNDTANDLTAVTAGGALIHVGGAGGHPVVTNQVMTFSYTPVGTGNALVILIGCRSPGITSMSLTAPGWSFAPISGLVGPSGFFDFISTFGAITPNAAPVTFSVTLTGGNGNCSSNDTTVLADEFSGNDITGGTTTFDAHNESLDPAAGGICTGAPITPANNNDAIWYACFDNVTGVSGGYTKGQDDAIGDWSEYKTLSGGLGVAQNPGFVTNPSFSSFGLGGVSIKAKAALSVPDLTVSKTHSGSFVRGQTGAIYTITVTNSGGAATAGTVTMTDTLPAALTPTAIGGTGWTCTLATLTCTRSDALAAVASYPAITLTVNVAANAPSSVTNTATVSGGGESNTTNDIANDITTITATNVTNIKLVQQNVNGNESSTSNISVSFTSNNTPGNFLIVTGSAARPASTLSISDTLGNTYTAAMGPVTDPAQDVTVYIWYVANCKGGANTVKITLSGTAALEIHVSEWAGLATTSPVDQIASATGTGTSVSSGSQITTVNGELIFGYGWVFNTASAGTGFTPISLVNGDLDEYQIQSTAGSAAATFTQASGTWFAAMATFKPASGSLSVTVSPKRGGLTITQRLPVSATVLNDVGSAGVMWSASGPACSGSSCGTFTNVTSTSATYIAPSIAGIYSITATSVADVTKSASNSIGVTDLSGVLTYHNNLSRDGSNTQEFALTTSNVNTTTFGKLFSCQADGAIYAQPLWVPNITVAGFSHNVIIVATQHESLYAFDADATPCAMLWHVNLIDSAHGGTSGETSVPSAAMGGLVGSGEGNISPEVGITGTPVIDPNTHTLYVVSKSVNASTQFFQRLHAIDLTTGNEAVTPKNIDTSITVSGNGAGAVAGKVAFDPRNENQRPGLVLFNGVVYVSWAAHEDHDPYHGWLIGFDASTLAPIANGVFNTTPNTVGNLSYSRGGIWMSGGAPAVDSTGNLFFITGNGTFDANTGGSNYGDSVVKLRTTGGLSVADYFTPLDQATLDANDTDFGSGAATILVDQPGGPAIHLVIGGGKQGNLFLLNRDNMGKFSSSTNNIVQAINLGHPIFATPVFWQNNLYIAGAGPLMQYVFNTTTGMLSGAPHSQSSTTYGFLGATPSLSSNGATNGIIWALDNSLYCTTQSPGCGATVLHAYDAGNLATDLWNSSQAAGNRDQAGHAVKFNVPTVANGKVYVGTRGNDSSALGELDVYGLLPN
jgi:uncharacterized repeat protein (TIGR01451 family)